MKNKFKIVFVLFTIIMSTTTTYFVFGEKYNKDVCITAHRGSSTFYPENTLLSIGEAINENADYVEIDVRTTKDNYVVLFHDDNLKRIGDSKKEIKDMTLKEVKEIDAGYYKDKLFKGEEIPTLEEVFEKYKGKIKFNIELKITNKNDVLPEKVAQLIHKYNMNNDVIVTSFDKDTIENYKKQNPASKTGLIISKNIEDIENINCDLISLNYNLLAKELVEKLHKNNKEVYVWTLNNTNRINHAIDLDVDNIITNNVTLAKGILRYKSEK